MISLLSSSIREKQKTILYYGLGGLAVLILYIAIYPSIKNQMEVINKLLETYPPALMKVFNFQANVLSNLGGYLSTETYGVFWPLILMFMTVSLCSSTISGEIENGTMGLLLSLPISRGRIYLAKYASILVALLIFVLLSVFAISPVAKAFSLSISFANVSKLSLMGVLLGAAVAGVAIFFSSLFSEKGRTNAVIGSILVLMYILNLVSNLKDNLSGLKYLSFFHYFDPAAILQNGTLNTTSIAVLFAVSLIFSVLGFAVFTKRDISV